MSRLRAQVDGGSYLFYKFSQQEIDLVPWLEQSSIEGVRGKKP